MHIVLRNMTYGLDIHCIADLPILRCGEMLAVLAAVCNGKDLRCNRDLLLRKRCTFSIFRQSSDLLSRFCSS